METFPPLMNSQELERILKQESITQEDKMKLASLTGETLINSLGDVNTNEYDEIHAIENLNIMKIINLTHGFFGKGQKMLNLLKEDQEGRKIILEMKTQSNNKQEQLQYIIIALGKFVLSDCDKTAPFQAKFEGKLPSKLFTSRQRIANEWYNRFTTYILKIAANIYSKSGKEEAFSYIILHIGYYLNKSQPFTYNKLPQDKDMNDTLFRIVEEFTDSQY